MRWVRCRAGTQYTGDLPLPRRTKFVVFGGLAADKRFLNDLHVLDLDNDVWYSPGCAGARPLARAFHVAVVVDVNLFIFGGRSGRRRLGDFWMLDTDTWQWVELEGYGELPSPRDFAAGCTMNDGKLVIHGGWDGIKWLSDVYILDTNAMEWRLLMVTGPFPAPRCGHSATMVEKRLLIFGGRGGGGAILGDLWALKGLFEGETEAGWTQLKLSGTAPGSRCGHSMTSTGSQVVIFGGHSTGGWLTRYDVYYDDAVVLDRATVQWKKLGLSSKPPEARAYHTLTRIGSRLLLFGGYNGKVASGDLWWLVPEDDPLAKADAKTQADATTQVIDEKVVTESMMRDLRARLGLQPVVLPEPARPLPEDQDLLDYRYLLQLPNASSSPQDVVDKVRAHFADRDATTLSLREVGVIFKDYRYLVAMLLNKKQSETTKVDAPYLVYRFYHLRTPQMLRLDDVPPLLNEYRSLLQVVTYVQTS
eukprot:SM000063S20072  [mRNA]  locus=s63:645048:649445:- [translate_table: standard]